MKTYEIPVQISTVLKIDANNVEEAIKKAKARHDVVKVPSKPSELNAIAVQAGDDPDADLNKEVYTYLIYSGSNYSLLSVCANLKVAAKRALRLTTVYKEDVVIVKRIYTNKDNYKKGFWLNEENVWHYNFDDVDKLKRMTEKES